MTDAANTVTRYIQYRTADGYVVQAFTWLGTPSFSAGTGYAFVADAANAYTPGSKYAALVTASAASQTAPAAS